MAKWVAANEMVMVRIKNPRFGAIIIPGKELGFVPEGVVTSMGQAAIDAIGEQYLNQTIRFTGGMQREVFGNQDKDEFLFVCMPPTAIVAVLQPEENDA
jgi:hypothetical protein